MKWTIEKIRRSFSGRLIGSLKMREQVCKTLLCLPSDMIKQTTSCVWFISFPDNAWALTFKGSDVADQHLVFISHELLAENPKKIKYTILHELGHVFLNHRNSMGFYQTDSEINQQEREADNFAKKYLKKTR